MHRPFPPQVIEGLPVDRIDPEKFGGAIRNFPWIEFVEPFARLRAEPSGGRPRPIERRLRQSGFDGIPVDITNTGGEIGVVETEYGIVSILEKMPDASVAAVEIAGISRQNTLHDHRQRNFGDFQREVNMIVHQTISEHLRSALRCRVL